MLVLYPEINTESRKVHPDWRTSGRAPLYEDYHPRDVRLVLDHARIPGRPSPHDSEHLVEEIGRDPTIDRIDLLEGIGHADREAFWAEYYRIVNNKSPHGHETYPHSAYVHIVYGDDLPESPYCGLMAIEYWLIYLYNDWKSTHEGDWELIVVLLRQPPGSEGQPDPIACGYSAHHGGYRLPWRQVEKANDQGERDDAGTHPVVYVANGSHANYFFGPGRYATTTEQFGVRITTGEFPFTGEFTDYATSFEDGARAFPDVKVVPSPVDGRWTDEWRWLNFRGEWGSLGVPQWLRWLPRGLRFRLLRRIWGAPASLPHRRNWSNPFAWVDHECEEAPPLHSWLARQ